MDNKSKKREMNFILGIIAGAILYKVIFGILWPMIFK